MGSVGVYKTLEMVKLYIMVSIVLTIFLVGGRKKSLMEVSDYIIY